MNSVSLECKRSQSRRILDLFIILGNRQDNGYNESNGNNNGQHGYF